MSGRSPTEYNTFGHRDADSVSASTREPLIVPESDNNENIVVFEEIEKWVAPGQLFNGTHYLWKPCEDASHGAQTQTVVCLHGIGALYLFWQPLALGLASRHCNVLYYDLLGRGFSEGSRSGHYGIDEHIQQLRELLDHLKLTETHSSNRLHIVGHSMGGSLAVHYAQLYPENVQSLSLLAPAGLLGYFPTQWAIDWCCCAFPLIQWLIRWPALQESSWRTAYYKPASTALCNLETMIRVLHQMYRQNPQTHNAVWRSAVEFPLTDISRVIENVASVPHIKWLFIWGENDAIVPVTNLQRWKDIVSRHREWDSDVHVRQFAHCGHSILGEHRTEAIRTVQEFIHQCSQKPTANVA